MWRHDFDPHVVCSLSGKNDVGNNVDRLSIVSTMVKRAKSPEAIEDSKFLTVVHPFPLNANMEVPNDFKDFMFWLASIVGKDHALGVYHKPSVSFSPFSLLNHF